MTDDLPDLAPPPAAPTLPHEDMPAAGPRPDGQGPRDPRRTRLVAGLVFVGVSILLFATQTPGFTRDESFYFTYSENYQEWFVDVTSAPTVDARAQALSRDPTMRIWSGNFEHPPLMKELFGFSWRIFAQKDRRAAAFMREPPRSADDLQDPIARALEPPSDPAAPRPLRFDVYAGRATGFEVGADVVLLAPLAQGGAVRDPTRELARGRVVERTRERAIVRVTSLGAKLQAQVTAATSAASAEPPLAASPDPEVEPDGKSSRTAKPRTRLESPPRDTELTALQDLCQPSRALGAAAPDPQALPITPCMGRELRTLDVLSESEAMRLPGILSGGLAAMLIFLLGQALFGRALIGLFGAGLFLFVPEHFFHAHLACFDMPIVAAQLLAIYAFWRSLDDRRWALVAGLAWGVALLTKHNAFFVPFSLIVFWLWCGRDAFSLRWVGFRHGGLRARLPSLPLAFLVMPVVGLTLLFSFWPRLWYDPLQSLRDWFGFHLQHEHYMQYWFGEPLQVPPFPVSYPFEKTLLTYPEVFLVLFAIGCLFLAPWRSWRPWLANFAKVFRPGLTPRPASNHERVAVFCLVNGLVPIAVIALPSTPIFGGIKHWMTGTPFIALIAAYGLVRLAEAIALPRRLVPVLAALSLVHPLKASIDHVWLGTHYYNTLFAGGLQGAADKKLMRIFWGHEARYACDWLNAHAPLNARVYWQDATWGTYEMYQREGWLRHDIRYHPGPEGADFALNETLQALWDTEMRTRRAFDAPGPDLVLAQDGVPYLNIYVRARD